MDPLTALSVAGNVVQFVEFSSKLISASYELYTKSELDCHAQAALATDDILDYTVQLRRTLRVPSESAKLTKEELLLEDICKGCDDLAKDLLARLDKLKARKNEKGQKMLWPTLTAAFQSLWTQKELLKIQDRLKDYRAQIDSRVMHSLSKLANLKFHELSERFDHLDAANKELASAIVNRNGYDDRGLQEQVSAVSTLLDRAEVVMDCHEESTKRVIVDVFQQLGLVANNQEDTQLLAEIRSTDREVQGLVKAELLDSLHFPTIAERFEAVEEAHTTTFDWVFRRVEDTKQYAEGRRWGDFSDWLQSGNGLYWINGKAGSGKSTLMKYLVNHGKTSSLLRRWARGSKLCTAAFFFWNSGSKQQRTQAGLLRSLLHRILGQHSELIPMVLPTQWTARYAARCLDAHYHDESWELSELETAFKTLITQTSVPLKLCLFIDGLDEYEGNDEDIASLFGRTLMSHNVKICCSSRPHQVFADAFASRPGLRLQDLTIPDMKKYVHDRLERHSRMQQLFKDEPMPSRKLIDEIGTAASGVFLWVRLVVSSLLNGLGAHDDILFLRKRLEEYPKELDEFFHQMIFKVDKVYQQERARLFQLVGATFRDREDEFTSWREIRQLSVLLISFASERNTALVLEAKPGFITKEAITTRCRRMEVLLRTRSGGLLEVQYGKHTHVAPDMGVSYLHRTVKDYLQLWETRQKLADETTNHQHDTFKATETIFKAHILALKARKAMTTTAQPPWTLIQDAITWAQRAERDTHTSQIEYLDEFYNTAQQLWQNSHSLQGAFFEQQKSMLTLATQCGLQHYLDAKLSQENVVSSWGLGRHRRSLLDYALVPDDATETFISEGMVSTLLKYGADPNRLERPFGTSPWQNALSHLNLTISEIGVGKQQDPKRQSYILHQWAPVIKLLLDSRADPYIESPVLVGHVEIGEDKFSGGIVWPPGKILDKAFATEPQILAELREALEKAKLASSRSKISESEEESDVPLPQTELSMSEPQEDLKPLKSPKPSETSVVEAEMVISQLEVKTMETEKGLGAQYDRRPTTRQKESRTKSRQQQLETSEPNRKKSSPCCVIL